MIETPNETAGRCGPDCSWGWDCQLWCASDGRAEIAEAHMSEVNKQSKTAARAARLIAEMIDAQSWSIPRDCVDHPILGPAVALRKKTYDELRHEDFSDARLTSNEVAIRFIIEAISNGR